MSKNCPISVEAAMGGRITVAAALLGGFKHS